MLLVFFHFPSECTEFFKKLIDFKQDIIKMSFLVKKLWVEILTKVLSERPSGFKMVSRYKFLEFCVMIGFCCQERVSTQ